jgi:lysophospholipid acyltransferase (LPLAT)-like uncharacterized protein
VSAAPLPAEERARRRSWRKRLLASRLARTALGTALRFYRWFAFGVLLVRHDRRLVALLRSRRPAVFVCWHQDFAHTLGYLSRFNPRRTTFVLASASRDGGLAAAAAEAIGFREAVRGSSSDRGGGALLRLERIAATGRASLAFVGDGPRPPARVLKPGAVHLAASSGLPVWLVRTSWSPDASLPRTWARFHVPRPWCRGVVVADGPIEVPPASSREALESTRRDVERRLEALAERGDAAAKRQSSSNRL